MNGRDVNERIKQLNYKLNALLDITLALSQNHPIEEIISQYQYILKDTLGISKILILHKSPNWKILLNSGYADDEITSIKPEEHLNDITDITFVPTRKFQELHSVDIILPLLSNNKPIAYVFIGDFDEESEGVSPVIKHVNYILTISRLLVIAIENERLFKESLKQEALKKELEFASRMQAMLIPSQESLPNNENYSFSAYYLPHLTIGGDYFDIIQFNENEVGFCIADVAGKGIPAAILMSNFQANLRAQFTPTIQLERMVETLNDRFIKNSRGESFITFFAGRYNVQTRKLEYINAGHLAPLLYFPRSQKLKMLSEGCPGIGMVEDITVKYCGSVLLEEPAKLLSFTDGLVEVNSVDGVKILLGETEEIISNNLPLNENIQQILKTFNISPDNTSIFDDVTILGVEFF
jgi:sigma-B regulation protein RsbU (phosphoserine phosphatase)